MEHLDFRIKATQSDKINAVIQKCLNNSNSEPFLNISGPKHFGKRIHQAAWRQIEKEAVEESSLWSNRLSSHLPPPHEPRQTEWQPTWLNISTSHYEKEASLRQSPQLAFRIQSALLHTKITLLLNLGAVSASQTPFYSVFKESTPHTWQEATWAQDGVLWADAGCHGVNGTPSEARRGWSPCVCYQESLKDGKRAMKPQSLLIAPICSRLSPTS